MIMLLATLLRRTLVLLLAVLVLTVAVSAHAQNARQLLPGVWRGSYHSAYGTTAIEYVFQPNGSFSSMANFSSGGYVYFAGPYGWVSAQMIRLTFQQAQPRQTCGPLGCNDMRYPEGESDLIRFVDANTMIMRVAACSPGVTVDGCEVRYSRAR